MNKLYCDASFDWNSTEKTTENVVRGKVAISDGNGFKRIEKVAIGKVEGLKQYINILELFAIGRAIELAILEKFEGILSIYSDSQVALGWAKSGRINPKVETEAHKTALEFVVAAKEKFGQVEFNYVSREHNPAGFLLQEELDNGNKPYDL